jgi:hypothetical protein
MIDATKVPERKLRHDKTRRHARAGSPIANQARLAVADAVAWRSERPVACSWPFKAEDTSPLAWWRRLPSDAFRDAERLLLLATLKRIAVLQGGDDFAAALNGDAASAIGVAFSMVPVTELTLKADIAMTALLRCALERNAAAALVLAQVLGLTDLGHSFATELSASWFTHGQRHSANPRKFSQAETALLAAFQERDSHGEGA